MQVTDSSACSLENLLARVAGGDESALRELYDRTSRRVYGLALAVLRDRVVAEDVALEVYVQAWRQAGRFDPASGSALAWLSTLARTRSIDAWRARRRQEARQQPLDVQADALASEQPGPRRAARPPSARPACVAPSTRCRPSSAARCRPPSSRALTHTEVAAALGQPLGTVKTRIRAGLAALRTALAEKEGRAA